MNRKKFFLLLFSAVAGWLQAQDTLRIDGSYHGENLYVQNPFANDGKGFCTQKVLVNGAEIAFENASAFEVDLKALNLKSNDKVTLEIIHGSNCLPRILNPCIDCNTICDCKFISEIFEGGEFVAWRCVENNAHFMYVIEQYRWNKWIKCGEVASKGGGDTMTYSYSVKKYLHSGENMFRIKILDLSAKYVTSPAVKFLENETIFSIVKQDATVIQFSGQTLFEVYDQNGNLIDRGFASSIDPRKYRKGSYFLNYDNRTMEFSN